MSDLPFGFNSPDDDDRDPTRGGPGDGGPVNPFAALFGGDQGDFGAALQQIGQLRRELLEPRYAHARIFVAWEHYLLARLVKKLVAVGGADSAGVPEWQPDDFDSIYVVTLHRSQGKLVASFTLDHEGLDGRPTACPP